MNVTLWHVKNDVTVTVYVVVIKQTLRKTEGWDVELELETSGSGFAVWEIA